MKSDVFARHTTFLVLMGQIVKSSDLDWTAYITQMNRCESITPITHPSEYRAVEGLKAAAVALQPFITAIQSIKRPTT